MYVAVDQTFFFSNTKEQDVLVPARASFHKFPNVSLRVTENAVLWCGTHSTEEHLLRGNL